MAETEMVADLVKVQAELPVMTKDTSNPFFKSKYVSLDAITETVFPILTKHRFAWITRPSFDGDNEPTLKYQLMHVSGQSIEGEMKLLLAKNDPQGQGSAITYARRYAIMSVLGIVADEDDDGNAASRRKASEPIPTSPPPKPFVKTLDAEQIKELGNLARRKLSRPGDNEPTKADIVEFLNNLAVFFEAADFTKITQDNFETFKKTVSNHGIKKGE